MAISRREFLQASGAAVLSIGGLPLLSGCAGLQRADIRPTNAAVIGLEPDELRLLELASLAPSGHNTQPWSIKIIEPHSWIISSDQQRWLPAVDPDQRETLLSIGAFLENLTLAAQCSGYATELEVSAKTPQDLDIAQIKLNKTKRQGSSGDVLDQIRQRRIVRKGYLADEIRPDDLKAITAGAAERFHYFSPSSRQGRYLTEGTIAANRQQIYNKAAQAELAQWLRWSDREAYAFRDGLTTEGMEISGLAGWYVRHFYERKDALTEGFRQASLQHVIDQTARHGGWLVLTSPDASLASLLECGRYFEQLALRVRSRRIGIQPMTQMLEEAPWRAEIAAAFGLNGEVQFLLRIGYLEHYPEPVSLRRPVAAFVRS